MPVQVAKWDSAKDAWTDEARISLFSGRSDVFLGTFPTSGMTVSGVAYELPTWERRTDVSGFSSSADSAKLLLTPVAAEGTKPSNTMGVARRLTTGQAFLTNQIVSLMGLDPSENDPETPVGDSFELLPTPGAYTDKRGGSQHPDKKRRGGHQVNLDDVAEHVLLPTPTVGMMMGGSKTRSGSRSNEKLLPGIAEELALLPTPQAHDAQKGKTTEQVAAMRARGHGVSNLNELVENDPAFQLLPTPTAMVANDGEGTASWLARRERVKLTANNGNGMGMPLTIAAKLVQESNGDPTRQQSGGGNESLDEPLPGQLSLLDEITDNG